MLSNHLLMSDFHLYFESPPVDQGDRWSGRQFRSYNAVQPPYGSSIDPVSIRKDKLRFLQSLWAAQAHARAKPPKVSGVTAPMRVMMCDEEQGLDAAGEMFGRAKCFWNVWDRPTWTSASPKVGDVLYFADCRPKSQSISMRMTMRQSCRWSMAILAWSSDYSQWREDCVASHMRHRRMTVKVVL